MAVPTENAVVPDKMQFPARPEAHHPGRQWVPDERDGFISWLRGEFAAANAIIDSLCHHLRTTGEPGEYDLVIGCIQQRRYNWTPILHMQQYFSIAEVMYALQQAMWHKQQRSFEQPKAGGKDFKRNSFNYRHGNRFDGVRESYSSAAPSSGSNANSERGGDRLERGDATKPKGENAYISDRKGRAMPMDKEGSDGLNYYKIDSSPKDCEQTQKMEQTNLEPAILEDEDRAGSKGTENTVVLMEGSAAASKEEEQELLPVPKAFLCNEICDGKTVNIFEGLKLYEDLLDSSEVHKIVTLASSLRMAGKNGNLQGNTFLASRKPAKGHGKETIQLGACIYEGPVEDENAAGNHREKKVEAIPGLLHEVFDKLSQQHIINVNPDYCIIDIFSEGEHSQPHLWLLRYGRPLFHLILTDCDMVFGRGISSENRGDYRGPLRLSLKAGSLLVLQGTSADLAKRAIPSVRKQRIVLTFGKSQVRDTQTSSSLRQNSTMSPSALPWAQHSNRPTNLVRRPPGPKNYGIMSAPGVLQPPHMRPQQPSPPNGIQPIFVNQPPVPISAVPYAATVPPVPASSGWTVAAAPRKADVPRLPVPGTGVFLPPTGPGHSPPHPASAPESSQQIQDTSPEQERTEQPSSSAEASPKDNPKESSILQSCNGGAENINGGGNTEKEGSPSPGTKRRPVNPAAPVAIAAVQ